VTEYTQQAVVRTASAALQGAFATTPFQGLTGVLAGAAEKLALLVQEIYLFARDWNEMNEANKLLAAGPYDLSLFKTYPLLGCYLIGNSDTSAIINMAVGDYGRAGWKFEVEDMVKKAQPVFEKSREVILASRYEIKGLQGMKGTVVDRAAKKGGLPTPKGKILAVPTGKIHGLIHSVVSKIDSALGGSG